MARSDPSHPAPAVRPGEDLRSIGAAVTAIPLARPPGQPWWSAFALALALLGFLGILLTRGAWNQGNDDAVVRAFDTASYEWWIGLACGSVLVSGILVLLGAEWRGAVNRIAETVALFATIAAGLYPIIHLGRPWTLWPQPRALPLGDALDVVSFLVVTLSLWSIGLLPDLACLRDRAREEAARQIEAVAPTRRIALLRARAYGIAASGWRGSAAHWQIWGQAYRIVALLAVLLVVSVQTGVAVGLAGSAMPGWHGTLLPVTFLIHAVLSGVGVTGALVVLVRTVCGLDGLVTLRHLDSLARLLLCLGCASAYCYGVGIFDTLLDGEAGARGALLRRMTGGHALAFWGALACLVLSPQLFWSARARRSPLALAAVGLLVAAGAYADRVTALLVGLTGDVLPSGEDAWGIATFAGSLGLFLCLILLFVRTLPAISITETRRLLPARAEEGCAPERPAAMPGPAATLPEGARQGIPPWGVAAAFSGEAELAAALQALSSLSGRVRLDGYGPVPMPRTLRPLGLEGRSILPFALAGAIGGGVAFSGLCLAATAHGDVLPIGGGARVSWPSFVAPSVSFAMLCGCLAVHAALLVLNRLPRLTHPAFAIPDFPRASQDRFFLSAEVWENAADAARIERRLAGLPVGAGRPLATTRVPR